MNTNKLTNEQKVILAAGVALERRARGLAPHSDAEAGLLAVLDGNPDLLEALGATIETARGAVVILSRSIDLRLSGQPALGGPPR